MILKTATGRNMFAIVAAGVITTVSTAGVLVWMAQRALEQQSVSEMTTIANQSARRTEGYLGRVGELAHNVSTGILALKEGGVTDRDLTERAMRHWLQENPFAIAISTCWEPNAFDSKDAQYRNKDGHDATGRFIPYIRWGNGENGLEPLVDYEKPGDGDWYLLPKKSHKDVLTEPYDYVVDGRHVLMMSFMVPLMLGGTFAGTVGIDVPLQTLANELDAIKPMDKGFVSLITGKGSLVNYPEASMRGKSLKDSGLNADTWGELLAHPDQPITMDGPNGADVVVAVPVRLLQDTTWYAIVSVPRAVLSASTTSLITTSVVIIAIAAGLMASIGALLALRFRKRLGAVIDATNEIATGRTDVDLSEATRPDEIGMMARSLAVLRDTTVAKRRLEQDVEGVRLKKSEEDRLRTAATTEMERQTRFVVDALAVALPKLSDGDTVYRIDTAFTGSLDQVRLAFNASVQKLHMALVSVGQNADAIHIGSSEIRDASSDLARRTERQAAVVEQTAAAIEEITASVRDVSRRAAEAGTVVERARMSAERSGDIVRHAVGAMDAIEKSSQEIGQIIGVIDEIAFQTNLLALNAGVEAARAGDAGRGFAVVASKVRALAQRSAAAAKEIKGLISTSRNKVSAGVQLVRRTGDALQTIADQVQEIDRNVSAIVGATREQAGTLNEISTAINSIDQGTQQNAAMVEEQSAASHSLAREVIALNDLLAQFRMNQEEHRNEHTPYSEYGHAA